MIKSKKISATCFALITVTEYFGDTTTTSLTKKKNNKHRE
jgi:hypothetical protein